MSDERQLDAEVAERIMGWRWTMYVVVGGTWYRRLARPSKIKSLTLWDGRVCEINTHHTDRFTPTTDMNAANQVVAAVLGRFFKRAKLTFELHAEISNDADGSLLWEASFMDINNEVVSMAESSSPSEAICKAALAVKGDDDGR